MLKILYRSELQNKICVIVGTRPGIVMFSPIIRELSKRGIHFFIVHAGQHFSYNMDRQFFNDLELPEPDYKLGEVKNCKLHGEQTARMLESIEKVLIEEKPRIVLVGGDANCNLAGALAARKLGIMVGHIEAGERSYDWKMPEEHNRKIIDHISEYLFLTNEKSRENLLKENVQGEIIITGNPIVDAALQNRRIHRKKSNILTKWGLRENNYFLLTCHREENVDSEKNLKNIILGMKNVSHNFREKIVFLAHPRTQKRIELFRLNDLIDTISNFQVKDAVGYIDFITLLSNARLVFTDSGGVQQESCIFKVPCVTLRENTEWVETLKSGVNILAGTEPVKILECTEKILSGTLQWPEPFGNGNAAKNIIDNIASEVLDKVL